MAVTVQLRILSAHPESLAEFWAYALAYQIQAVTHSGGSDDIVISDPAGLGPVFRFAPAVEGPNLERDGALLLRLEASIPGAAPEVRIGQLDWRAGELVAQGATVIERIVPHDGDGDGGDDDDDGGDDVEAEVVLADPEGNRFALV